ncbi:MAG: hypothetical protein HY842_20400 [Bacteroidetes bacterium]|nr:hypothetical protein [Bacteroidota bacterium]
MPKIKFFSHFGKRYDDLFIPVHLRESPLSLRKARVLVFIHLFLVIISVLFEVANSMYPGVESPATKIAIVVGLTLVFIFKRYGNFNISGNLLGFCLFLIFLESVFKTGGLYSDNLLWMMATPLIALLFANTQSGMIWLGTLIGVTIFFFVLDVQNPGFYRNQTTSLDAAYYFITYTGLFIMVVGIVLIFATGQSMIIKALDEKQKELTRQKAELARQTQALLEAEEKLKAINIELEQFAYSASHDLKEPLRMIGSYTQLIKRKLAPHIEGSTEEYMGFVTDGVARMEKMLNDLLEYSRLGRNSEQMKEVDLNETLLTVMKNLMAAMRDTDTAIFANGLPMLKSSATEMMRLFQNLIANSIKFRNGDRTPVIDITCQTDGEAHRFRFMDNGIGIPDEHRQSVFNIFERLHSNQKYEGSGIGLATCKKIVNSLGGTIWVEPGENHGTAFVFTIPKERQN